MTELSDGTIVTDLDAHDDNLSSVSAATRSVTSRPGTNRTTTPTSTGTHHNSAKQTFPTEHSNRGWPTGVGPFRTYHQAAHDVSR